MGLSSEWFHEKEGRKGGGREGGRGKGRELLLTIKFISGDTSMLTARSAWLALRTPLSPGQRTQR